MKLKSKTEASCLLSKLIKNHVNTALDAFVEIKVCETVQSTLTAA